MSAVVPLQFANSPTRGRLGSCSGMRGKKGKKGKQKKKKGSMTVKPLAALKPLHWDPDLWFSRSAAYKSGPERRRQVLKQGTDLPHRGGVLRRGFA